MNAHGSAIFGIPSNKKLYIKRDLIEKSNREKSYFVTFVAWLLAEIRDISVEILVSILSH